MMEPWFFEDCGLCPKDTDTGHHTGIIGGPVTLNQGRCPRCSGRGIVPTKAGQHLLRFFRIFVLDPANGRAP